MNIQTRTPQQTSLLNQMTDQAYKKQQQIQGGLQPNQQRQGSAKNIRGSSSTNIAAPQQKAADLSGSNNYQQQQLFNARQSQQQNNAANGAMVVGRNVTYPAQASQGQNDQSQIKNFQGKLSASQPQQVYKKGANSSSQQQQQQPSGGGNNSMMSSGPQPSTSISSAGYNNMLRGMARDSNSMHSAKAGGAHTSQQQQQASNHVYQLSQSNNTADGMATNNSLSVNGMNEKLLYKGAGGSQIQRGGIDNNNSSNGYLLKSAQTAVKQIHQQHHGQQQQFIANGQTREHQKGAKTVVQQPLTQKRDLYSGKSVGVGGLQGRERGLSASALDQGRVTSQIRNKNDARNYSVGVHKKMHGTNQTHPSQSNIGQSQQFQPQLNGKGLMNQSTQSNTRPSAGSNKKAIKTIPVRSPHSMNRGMGPLKHSPSLMDQQILPEIRTQQIQSQHKISNGAQNSTNIAKVGASPAKDMIWKLQSGSNGSNSNTNHSTSLNNTSAPRGQPGHPQHQIMPQFINPHQFAYQQMKQRLNGPGATDSKGRLSTDQSPIKSMTLAQNGHHNQQDQGRRNNQGGSSQGNKKRKQQTNGTPQSMMHNGQEEFKTSSVGQGMGSIQRQQQQQKRANGKPPTMSEHNNHTSLTQHDGVSDTMPNIQSAMQAGEMSSEEGGDRLINNQMADDGSISPMHKTGQGDGGFYEAAQNVQDQDDSDDQVDDDDDLIDDDIIDEEAALELQKNAIERAGSFDSQTASDSSPLPNQKKVRSMRHAATLAAETHEHRSHQNFDTDQKPKAPARGSSNPLGGSHTGKMMQAKKTKLMAVQDPSHQPDESGTNDQYSPRNVVAKMLMKKDRKIPGSVYKPHSEEIILLQSVALGQPQPSARVYFTYPKYCTKDETGLLNEQSNSNNKDTSSNMKQTALTFLKTSNWAAKPQLRQFQKVQIARQEYFKQHQMVLGFKISETTHIYNSVVNTLKTAGFRIVGPNSSKWNVMWTGQVKPEHLKEATKYQKMNHFPQSFQVGRKDMMWKNICRMKRVFQEFNFCPKTYLFPDDYRKFCMDREAENYRHMYIMKPSASSCGRGIKVVGQKQEVKRKPGYVVSQYVSNPHLIDGFKYDLRIYALVTCFDPLKIYLFKEGLVRFATQKYTNSQKNVHKQYIHLTNYSVNKKNDDYIKNTGTNGGKDNTNEDEDGENASKWNLAQLKAYFDKVGINYKTIQHRIKDVIIKTLQSVEPHIVSTISRCTKHRNVCFETYGFDILLDSKLKPWLLEVNISPSLSSSSPLDKKIKTMLICDTLNLVGVYPYDRKQYERETEQNLKKRLLGLDRQQSKEDNVLQDLPSESYLGKLMRQLFKGEESLVTEDDLQIILDFEEEQFRLGNFEKIFPCINNVQYYSQFFECQRNANTLLMRYLSIISPKHNPHHICFVPTGPAMNPGSNQSKKKRSNAIKSGQSGSSASNNVLIKQTSSGSQGTPSQSQQQAAQQQHRQIENIYEQQNEEGEEEMIE